MIYKPSNHSPNMQEIDLDKDNTFSCLVNTSGEPVYAYKLSILSREGDETIYTGETENLKAPVPNKGQLNMRNINKDTHDTGKTFENGKDYQWSVRVYNAKANSLAQPNTKVCEGYLVGSTKNVVWSKIEANATDALDQLVYDRYIEVKANSASELIIGAHEPDTVTLPTSYPYIQREKISWVTKELGTDKDYVKIETEDPFDYNYLDGHDYQIYLCSDKHTVTSAFADPNTSINVSNVVVLYPSTANAYNALMNGCNPGTSDSYMSNGYESRKIVGYSSDTGEIRVHDAWPEAPTNGMVYRVFTQDVSTKLYSEVFHSDLSFVFPAGENNKYYASTIVATSAAPVTYYSDINLTANAGTLMINSSCDFCKINDNNVPVSTITKGSSVYYVQPTTYTGTSENYTAVNVDGRKGVIVIDEVSYHVPFSSLKTYIKGSEVSGAAMYDPQKIGGLPITNNKFIVRSNKWGSQVSDHRLFIQPNINIKPDTTNPNEIVFDNGVRVDIKENHTVTSAGKTIDTTFNKLDDTQWLIENIENSSVVKPPNTEVPIVPQTDYTVYTDFADSMPNNIVYARKEPKITLQFRNAIKELKEGYYENGEFYNVDGVLYEGSALYLYYDTSTEYYYHFDNDTGYTQTPSKLLEGRYNSSLNQFLNDDNTIIMPSSAYLYYDKDGKKYYLYQNNTYEETTGKEAVWVDVGTEVARDYREVRFRALWEDDPIYTVYAGTQFTDISTSVVITSSVDIDTSNPNVHVTVYSDSLCIVTLDDAIGNLPSAYYYVNNTKVFVSDGNTMEDPQIKSYQYSLYAYGPGASTADLIKQSEINYSTNTVWTFRGLDGTASTYYNILNPHIYNIAIKIVDEYDKEYDVAKDFSIYYDTDNAPISIKVDFLCDDQANEVNISAPAYAETTDYSEEIRTVTESNLDTANGKLDIGPNQTLNYTQVSSSGSLLSFPKSFTMYSKFDLTAGFVNKYEGQTGVFLMEVGHDLDSITQAVLEGKTFYNQQIAGGKPYYLDAACTIEGGTLPTARTYTIYDTEHGWVYLTDALSSIYYIKLSDVVQTTNTGVISDKNADITISSGNISRKVEVRNGAGTSAGIANGDYYVFSTDIDTTTNTEIFTYKLDLSGLYKQSSDGLVVNNDCYGVTLWHHNKGEVSEQQELNCFYIGDDICDSVNLMSPDSPDGLQITTYYALQKNANQNGDYIFVATADAFPSAVNAVKNKKYVLLVDISSSVGEYVAGIYRAVQASGGSWYWEPVLDEGYVFVDTPSDIDGIHYDNEFVDGDNNFIWREEIIDNATPVWVDGSSEQSVFINYIVDYYIIIFLRVEYINGVRTVKSQVQLERKA